VRGSGNELADVRESGKKRKVDGRALDGKNGDGGAVSEAGFISDWPWKGRKHSRK